MAKGEALLMFSDPLTGHAKLQIETQSLLSKSISKNGKVYLTF
jgi:hypothetical protein